MVNLSTGRRGAEPEMAATPARGDLSESDAGGGALPGVVFVGTADAMGRVLSLVEALVAELGGLSLEGAGRGVLRTLVAALGRVRAGADAAEARTMTALDDLGDGGVDAVEVLRHNAGSSHREARRRRQRAGTLAKMPKVTEALAKGDISPEHADALARAASATSPETVDEDAALLAQVAAVPADRAGRQIQDWTQQKQDPADLHEQHLRQRRRRRLHFGDGDDGMLMAHAAFDRVLGAQFRSLINGIADRIWRAEGGRDNPDARSVEQRRLDALAIAVGLHPAPTGNARAHSEASAPQSGFAHGNEQAHRERPATANRPATGNERAHRERPATANRPAAGNGTLPSGSGDGPPTAGRPGNGSPRALPPRHQIVVVASADVVSGKNPQGRCEIPGVGPIPQSELERLTCDAELFGLLFSGDGEPLWHGRGKRTATDAQRRSLVARDGGCVLCAAEPAWCEAHHIVPWAKPTEGPTDIDNLALLCNACHHRLHDHKHVLVRCADNTWSATLDPRYARLHDHKRVLTPCAESTWSATLDPRYAARGDRAAERASTGRHESRDRRSACNASAHGLSIDLSTWRSSPHFGTMRPPPNTIHPPPNTKRPPPNTDDRIAPSSVATAVATPAAGPVNVNARGRCPAPTTRSEGYNLHHHQPRHTLIGTFGT